MDTAKLVTALVEASEDLPIPITLEDFGFLLCLHNQGVPTSMQETATAFGSSISRVHRLLTRFTSKDPRVPPITLSGLRPLVATFVDPGDTRRTVCAITPEGRAFMSRIFGSTAQVQ
jgi:DNA-binding MarR family transcriptional regulator